MDLRSLPSPASKDLQAGEDAVQAAAFDGGNQGNAYIRDVLQNLDAFISPDQLSKRTFLRRVLRILQSILWGLWQFYTAG